MFYKHSMSFNSKSTLNRDNVGVCGRGEGWELYIRFCMGPNVWCNTMQALYGSRCLMQYHASSTRDPISTAVPCWFSKESKVCYSTAWYPPPTPPKPVWHAPNPQPRRSSCTHSSRKWISLRPCPLPFYWPGSWCLGKHEKNGLVNEPPSFPLQKPRQCLLWKVHLLLVWRQLMVFPVHTIISCFCATATHASVDALYSWLAGPLCFFKRKHACEWNAVGFYFIFLSCTTQLNFCSVSE